MKRLLLASTVGAGMLLSWQHPAGATLQIALDVQGSTFTCFDNQAGCDTDSAIGTIQLANQAFSGVAINGSVQTANLAGGILNTSSLSIINSSGFDRTIAFAVGATNFVGPANAFSSSTSATFETAAGSTLSLGFYDDPANAQGAATPTDHPGFLLDSVSHVAVGAADSFSHNGGGSLANPDGALYSMTETASGTLVAGGTIINRGQTLIKNEVPEPSGIGLMVVGLGFLGLCGLRGRKPAAATLTA
jgi:hypothetical protein